MNLILSIELIPKPPMQSTLLISWPTDLFPYPNPDLTTIWTGYMQGQIQKEERVPERRRFTPTYLDFSFTVSTSTCGLSVVWNPVPSKRRQYFPGVHSNTGGKSRTAFKG